LTVYAVLHNPCIYESAAGVKSLHWSKRGALRAMIALQYEAWVQAREDFIRYGDGDSMIESYTWTGIKQIEVQA